MNDHTADELVQAYARGERNFSYWKVAGIDLHGADLHGSIFYGADLSGANLSGANLSRATLAGADLRNANLSCANLSNVFYGDANLAGADMSGVIHNNPAPTGPAAQVGGVMGVDVSPAPAAAADTNVSHYCINCGANLPADAQFCPRCGQAQANAHSAATSTVSPSLISPSLVSPSLISASFSPPPVNLSPASTPPATPPATPPPSMPPAYKPVATSSGQIKRPVPAPQIASKKSSLEPLVVTALVAGEVWGFIYKSAIVVVVIVGIVVFFKSCAANATLNEHSSCGQFQQADATMQNQVLQDMMNAHHDTSGNIQLTRFSVNLYCNVYGPSAPIDGIYNGGGYIEQRPAQALRGPTILAPARQVTRRL